MGDFERTLDIEVVARNGYDATPLWNKLVEIGEREGQEAVFLSRVLREGEAVDPTFHRPGVELYFAKPITLDQAKPLMALINEAGVHGMTMVTEGRRTPSAMAGEDQGIVGIRMQHIPEFMLGYGYNVGATDAEIVSSIESALGKMDDLVAELKKQQETSTVTRHWYETRVHKYGNATGISGDGSRTGDREVWSGQRISEGLQGADRFARDGQAPLAARRAELLRERSVSRGRADKAGGNRSAKYSPSRSGAGNESGTGSLRAPAYGAGQQGSVSVTGVHYSKAERSSLAGHYYGQGMKGAEGQRLNRESATKEQRRRVHFYVDEGSGIRPESDVGDHAHQTQLDNLYDVNGDPLNLWDEARDAYKDPVDRFNKMEQLVMERGFDGVYVPEAQGSQGVAVLLGSKHVAVPAQYIGTGYRGGDAKLQATQPKPQANTAADKVEAARVLPAGQMTGAEWKRLIPAVVPGVDASMLDDAKIYYKSDVVSAMRGGARLSPARQTDTPEFKAWFGDSKVVDENGQPLVVYHGTVARSGPRTPDMGDIKAFDRLYTTRFRGASIDTLGSWFSTNPGQGGAEMYSGRGEGSAVYPVYLSIKNPQVTTFQLIQRRARLLANGKDDGRRIGEAEVNAYRKWLKEMGKDGVKIEASGNEGSTEFDNQVAWIALEPEQIKSAVGNTGAFDPKNPDIRFSPSRVFFSQLARSFEEAPDRIFGRAA